MGIMSISTGSGRARLDNGLCRTQVTGYCEAHPTAVAIARLNRGSGIGDEIFLFKISQPRRLTELIKA
jgi:hypothetical protein